ncbi:hypothetical protein GY45DRAFT_448459 [Cubamyces sp. BRFM 1775]|nr:hypothetical protein GY45DRAFT_448459 [Cubamyces sp. BRFM 1775]
MATIVCYAPPPVAVNGDIGVIHRLYRPHLPRQSTVPYIIRWGDGSVFLVSSNSTILNLWCAREDVVGQLPSGHGRDYVGRIRCCPHETAAHPIPSSCVCTGLRSESALSDRCLRSSASLMCRRSDLTRTSLYDIYIKSPEHQSVYYMPLCRILFSRRPERIFPSTSRLLT